MRLILLLLALCAAMPVAAPARAEAVAGLYEAGVAVPSQDDAARDAGIARAFEAVLVKVSGSRTVLSNPQVAEAVRGASASVVQFYFRSESLPPDDTGAQAPELQLHASFRPAAVDELLRRAGEPRLSQNRPATLLWLAVDDGLGAGPRLVNRDADPATAAWIERAAARRGVPLVFPALDLEETMALAPATVAALDESAVAAASARYGAPSLMLGRLVRSGEGQWLAEWKLRIGEETAYAQASDATRAGLAGQLADAVAEALSARFAVRTGLANAEELRIRVDGIGTLAAYRGLTTQLARLGSVRESRPALVDGSTVYVDLLTDSGIDAVLQELGLVQQLVPEGEALERRYRWAGG